MIVAQKANCATITHQPITAVGNYVKNTSEQEAIIHCNANTLIVNAFAGTGKTYSLVEYAMAHPDERMLYLAYNRSIKEEAAKKFPKNVRCVTTHGVAFPRFGVKYKNKLGNPKASHLSKALAIDVITAGRTLAVINNFLTSADRRIGYEHVFNAIPMASSSQVENAISLAEKGWSLMQDLQRTDVPMPHDGYLKLYQLSCPIINTDIILFDESQDANPVTLDIVLQQNSRKILVGDKYQSIYGFRGAINALASVKADKTLYLTTSFRFGEGIAKIASALLQDWQKSAKTMSGCGQYETVFHVNRAEPHAFIARTNGKVFGEAVRLVKAKIPFGFVGGVEGYRLDQVLSVYQLYARNKSAVRDPYYASFKDYEELKQYGEALDDKEIKSLTNVVEEYRHEIPKLIDQIRETAIPHLTGKEIALSTAHKAKGLEFLDVVMADDFAELTKKRDELGKLVGPDPEEVNIIYVVLTRAMRGIELPDTVKDWLINSGRSSLITNTTTGKAPKSTHKAKAPGNPFESIAQQFRTLDDLFSDLHAKSNTPEGIELRPAIVSYLQAQISRFNN